MTRYERGDDAGANKDEAMDTSLTEPATVPSLTAIANDVPSLT